MSKQIIKSIEIKKILKFKLNTNYKIKKMINHPIQH